jgi:hypothetical protein
MEPADVTKAAAIHAFWNQFGIPAYEENTVPEDATYPYITYQLVTDAYIREVVMTASVWYRSTSWMECNAKAEEIGRTIGMGGTVLRCDDGRIWLKRGTPFSQSMGDESDDLVKRKYINISAEYITAA